jgi:FeS assembly SUF system protein
MNNLVERENQSDTALGEALVAALRKVYDPEIPVNIYDLGLIYRLDVDAAGRVEVDMTLTAPACPVAGTMPGQVGRVIESVPGVSAAIVRLVWDPPWSQGRMTEEARLQLGLL